MKIPHSDPRISWPGAISLEQTANYTRPWRIPFHQRAFYDPGLLVAAGKPAGVRLTFRSTSCQVAGEIEPFNENQKLDLYVDGNFVASQDLANKSGFCFDALPTGEKEFELWLPQSGDFALRHLEFDEASTLQPLADPRPKWITYGSSITHCRDAESPSLTWPAIVAREKSLNLTCLGFGGQCHLDFLLAPMIRDLPADYISLCVGINIYGLASLTSRTFGPNLIGFVQVIREKHPETPLLVVSPIYCADREVTPNRAEWTLQDHRSAVASAVETLQAAGDANIFYFNGLDLFDASLRHLMPDGNHPNAEGYRLLASNFLARSASILFEKRAL